MKIILDPCGGYTEPIAVTNKHIASDLTLEIVKYIYAWLTKIGYEVETTRSLGNDIPINRYERTRKIRGSKSDFLVSVDIGTFHNDAWGYTTLYAPGDLESEHLAVCIQNRFKKAFPENKNRDMKETDQVYILKTLKPCCLIRVGFLETEEDWICDNIKNIAKAICNGIIDYTFLTKKM